MTRDPINEMRFALAEGGARDVPARVRSRTLQQALAGRPTGFSSTAGDPVSGLEVFSAVTARLEALLRELDQPSWRLPSIRGLDVQQLVGHLTAVERDLAAVLRGDDGPAGADHVAATQDTAMAQTGRDPTDTLADWVAAVVETRALAGGLAPTSAVRLHGVSFDLDGMLVVRSFELWSHDEDIRRATGRPLVDPDGSVLDRMTDLAAALLPLGVSLSGGQLDGPVRLVLTGPGGGSWDVPASGGVSRAAPGRRFDAHLTIDAASFCRIVANRLEPDRAGPVVAGREELVGCLLTGAATLALD